MSWKASAWSLETHVKVNNNSQIPVVVFAYNFTDPVYGEFKDSKQLEPGSSAVLKAMSEGAGKITIGLAVGVAKQYGEGFVEWADISTANYADHRYKLRLRNVADNTECSIEQRSDNSLFVSGEKVTKCEAGDTWVVQGPSSTGMAILQTIKALRAAAAPSTASSVAPAATNRDEQRKRETPKAAATTAKKTEVHPAPASAKSAAAKPALDDEWEVVGRSAKGAKTGGERNARGVEHEEAEVAHEEGSQGGGAAQRKKGKKGAKPEAPDATQKQSAAKPEKQDDRADSENVGGGAKKKNKKGGRSAGKEPRAKGAAGSNDTATLDTVQLALYGGVGVGGFLTLCSAAGVSYPFGLFLACGLAIVILRGRALLGI